MAYAHCAIHQIYDCIVQSFILEPLVSIMLMQNTTVADSKQLSATQISYKPFFSLQKIIYLFHSISKDHLDVPS